MDDFASLRVLEKCGFSIVGYERGFACARGEEIEEVCVGTQGRGTGSTSHEHRNRRCSRRRGMTAFRRSKILSPFRLHHHRMSGGAGPRASTFARFGVGGPKRAKGKKDRHGVLGTGREAQRLSALAQWRANGIHLTRSPPAQKGVPAPSVRKPTVRTADEGCSGPVLRQIPPVSSPAPKHCAQFWRAIRRVRNLVPRAGVLCAISQGSIPGVNMAQNTASSVYRSGETGLCAQAGWYLDIAHNTLP
jgi:hypothetical protein